MHGICGIEFNIVASKHKRISALFGVQFLSVLICLYLFVRQNPQLYKLFCRVVTRFHQNDEIARRDLPKALEALGFHGTKSLLAKAWSVVSADFGGWPPYSKILRYHWSHARGLCVPKKPGSQLHGNRSLGNQVEVWKGLERKAGKEWMTLYQMA